MPPCPQPRRPVLCAAFDGKLNSKACPQSFVSVITDAACQSLAAIGGKAYGGSVNVTTLPSGCLWLTVGGGVYLNTHATGAAHPNAQQLCAGAPAPPRAPDVQGTETRAGMVTHARCDIHRARRRVGTSALRLGVVTSCCFECDYDCRARCRRDGANVQPSPWYGRSSSMHRAWPARPGRMRCSARICAGWRVELCAAFQIGGTNRKGCPANYSRLETEAACISLAAIAGSTYDRSDNYEYYPAGCFRHTVSRKFYWNTHGSGASNSFAQPLCAGAPATPRIACRRNA
jgi:hypothetical protein